jgi:hypothetical protein
MAATRQCSPAIETARETIYERSGWVHSGPAARRIAMRCAFHHFGLAIGGVLLCAGGFFYLSSNGISGRVNPASPNTLISNEDLSSESLRRLAVTDRRIEIRKRIANEVIAGKMSLLQAAEQYRDLNEASATFCPEAFHYGFSGRNDDERTCRQVISYVKQQFSETPEKGKATVGRLEQELAALVRDEMKLPR